MFSALASPSGLGTAPGRISWEIKLLPEFWHASKNTLDTLLSGDQKITLMLNMGSSRLFFIQQGIGIVIQPQSHTGILLRAMACNYSCICASMYGFCINICAAS